jgi:hypothetical protein
LRIEAEGVAEAEGCGVILAVFAKLLAKLDESAVQPSEHVAEIFRVCLAHSPSGHDRRRRLLVE